MNLKTKLPDERGHFGIWGGKFVPETLMPALKELNQAYEEARKDHGFWDEFNDLCREYVGRPTPLYYAKRLSQKMGGAKILLKREDLAHTGAHKINNALGQGLLARRMGKKRIIAETGAGQHGVATATICALLGLECIVYMGEEDIHRQSSNVFRMKILGAEVRPVLSGSRTLKDAINEAIRDWVTNVRTTHYLIGSVVGPHPYPMMVRDLQSIIGRETREQILSKYNRLPDYIVACVGGGSNAIGIFHAFLEDEKVKLVGVEAAGRGLDGQEHCATLMLGSDGVLHGAMQLRRLAAMERQKIDDEYAELLQTIAYLEDLLANPRKIDYLIKEEMLRISEKYGDERRTELNDEEIGGFTDEELIAHQQVVVTVSDRGYVKRLPSHTYRTQHRGGKGVSGMKVQETDDVRHLLITDTHDTLLFFTTRGRVFRLKCYQLPQESTRQAKGLPIINLIPIENNEHITAIMSASNFPEDGFIVMATEKGEVKKSELKRFSAIRSTGIIAMNVEKGDSLISVKAATQENDAIIVTRKGQSIRFSVDKLRTASRTSGGVRGIRLIGDDRAVAMDIIRPNAFVLTVTQNGYGKRTPVDEYRQQIRGGSGIRAHLVNEKTGPVKDAAVVDLNQQLMVTTKNGTIIRTLLKGISKFGRSTQGVRTIRLNKGDSVASIALIDKPEESLVPDEPFGEGPTVIAS